MTLLPTLILKKREQEATMNACSRQVVPDFTNLAETGLGVTSLHFVAMSLRDSGFQKRLCTQGEDIPVVVREPWNSDYRGKTVEVRTKCVRKWRGSRLCGLRITKTCTHRSAMRTSFSRWTSLLVSAPPSTRRTGGYEVKHPPQTHHSQTSAGQDRSLVEFKTRLCVDAQGEGHSGHQRLCDLSTSSH